jgi:hypothetical protein
LQEPEGVANDLFFGAIEALVDLTANQGLEALGDCDIHR